MLLVKVAKGILAYFYSPFLLHDLDSLYQGVGVPSLENLL